MFLCQELKIPSIYQLKHKLTKTDYSNWLQHYNNTGFEKFPIVEQLSLLLHLNCAGETKPKDFFVPKITDIEDSNKKQEQIINQLRSFTQDRYTNNK